MKHRLAVAALAVVLMIGTLAGAHTRAASKLHTNSESFTLTFWMLSGVDTTTEPYKTGLKLFHSQYPNATVNFVVKGRPEQLLSALQTAMMAHNAPDLYLQQIGNGDEGQFIQDHEQLNLDPYVKKYGWDTIYPRSILASQRKLWGGVYGVPHTNYWMGLYYKKDVLRKYNLPVPTTYSQLLQDCAVLKAHGIVPFLQVGFAPAVEDRLIDAILETISPPSYRDALLAGKAPFNSPYLLKAFTMFQHDFVGKGYFQPGFESDAEAQVYQIFLPGRGGFWLSGNWEWATWAASNIDLRAFNMIPFPTGKDRIVEFQQGFFIDQATKYPDAAAALLDDIESRQAQLAEGKSNPALARLGVVDTSKMTPDEVNSIRLRDTRPTYVLLNEMGLNSPLTDQLYTVTAGVSTRQLTPLQAVSQLDSVAKQYHWYR